MSYPDEPDQEPTSATDESPDHGWIRPKRGPSRLPKPPSTRPEDVRKWREEMVASGRATRQNRTGPRYYTSLLDPVGTHDGTDGPQTQEEGLKPPHPPYPTRAVVNGEDLPDGVYHCFLHNDRENSVVEMKGTLAGVLDWALHDQHADEISLWNQSRQAFDALTPEQAEQLRRTQPDT